MTADGQLLRVDAQSHPPAERHGRLVIMAMLLYVGGPQAGQHAVAPFHALAAPLADMVRPMRYPEIYAPEEPDYHPTAVAHTMFVDQVDRRVAETIVKYLRASDATLRVAQLRVPGGALTRVPADATAFAHRESRIMVTWPRSTTVLPTGSCAMSGVSDFAAVPRQGDPGAYVGFLGEEGQARIGAAYPGSGSTWDRLIAIKRRYDSTNLFRLNQNIPPSIERAGQ